MASLRRSIGSAGSISASEGVVSARRAIMSIWRQWGLEPIINASGSVTRLGGAPMPADVLEAYVEAARECVPLDQVQGMASRVLSAMTGAEAGIVTSGAAAALTLGTAAILTG